MNTLKLLNANTLNTDAQPGHGFSWKKINYKGYFLVLLLLSVWPILQWVVLTSDPSTGFIDPNIWLLLLFCAVSFLLFLGLSWWLLKLGWQMLGLPSIYHLVSQFNQLQLWQQLGFYWASFALLLLGAVGILNAVI